MNRLSQLLERNKQWATTVAQNDPKFFQKLSALQRPEYLWIGCSDSRVPANQITGLLPGEVFVHRNVGNIVGKSDLNCLSVVQYAVDILTVKHIIVCGHYGCGAIQTIWDNKRAGLIDYWLSPIRSIREKHEVELEALQDPVKSMDRLCELNVLEQASGLCKTSLIQDAWARGQELTVHSWIYRLTDGRLHDLGFCASSVEEAAAQRTSSL